MPLSLRTEAYSISIHSPHTRGDSALRCWAIPCVNFNPLPSHEGRRGKRLLRAKKDKFQSTPLTRGETETLRDAGVIETISIHSPHTRGDSIRPFCPLYSDNFNPLPSHEGRRKAPVPAKIALQFQSTPLTRGETTAAASSRELL